MYCPKCKAEYREGFYECADCHVPLVGNLSVEEAEPIRKDSVPEFVDLEEVMTSFNAGEITMARSILDDNEISYLVQGDYFSFDSIPARILVPKGRVNEAKNLLHDFL